MSTQTALLEVRDLRKTFGGIVAVDDPSFDIERGTVTGLIGPNGAGKTTTFNLISGFLKPDEGTVRYDGVDLQEIMRPSSDEQRRWTIGSGLVGGGIGLTAASGAGLPLAMMASAGAVGLGIGAGGYLAQERVKSSRSDFKYSHPFRIARDGMIRTFQITRELKGLSVLENLKLAPQAQPGESLTRNWLQRQEAKQFERDIEERAHEMIELLELEHLTHEYAGNLSGGQRKLVELGRVLMAEPELILLDEPVAGVNPTLTMKLLDRIENLREEGYTFCLIEHDMEVIMNLSDKIIVMDQGSKLMEGTPDEVQGDERVIDAYLGDA